MLRPMTFLLAALAACAPRPSEPAGGAADAAVDAPDASMPAPTQVRLLVALGSSSTAGTGASSVETRYVNVLARALGARLVNLGTGGQTVDEVSATYLPMALAALDAGPPPPGSVDVVTFLPFTDFATRTAPRIAEGYQPVLARLDGAGAWVMFGLPVVDARYQCGRPGLRGPGGECYPASLVEDYAAKVEAMRAVIAEHPDAWFVDVPMMQAQRPDFQQPDGHPTDEGHAFLAEVFRHAIAQRMGLDAGPPPYAW